MFKKLKIKYKLALLVTIFSLGFIVFGTFAYKIILDTKFDGDTYHEIAMRKDLVADILPPPEYIIETYLSTFQILNEDDSSEIDKLVNKENALMKEYNTRHEIWVKMLPDGEMKKLMVEDSYTPAKEYFNVFEQEFIPAVRRGDKAKAKEILDIKLSKLYAEHRAAIDKVVAIANNQTVEIEQKAKESYKYSVMFLILIAVAIIFIAVAFCIVLIFTITSPLKKVVSQIDKTSKFDLEMDSAFSSVLEYKDEMGVMADAVTVMRNNLRCMVEKLMEVSGNLTSNSEEITATMDEYSKAANEVAASINEMAISNVNQAEIVSNTSEKLSEIVEIIGNAKNVSMITSEAAKAALETVELGQEAFDFAYAKTEENVTVSQQVGQAIQNLNDSIQKVGGFIETINSIANQTNLLALNAAIEAARAGETGKGFAVVAEEIRNLAESSASSAKEITSIVRNTIHESELTLENMNNSSEIVDNQAKAIVNMGEAFRKIKAGVGDISRQAESSSVMLNNIDSAIIHLDDQTKRITEVTEQSAEASQEISSSSEEQASSIETITEASNELSGMAMELNKEISRFKF